MVDTVDTIDTVTVDNIVDSDCGHGRHEGHCEHSKHDNSLIFAFFTPTPGNIINYLLLSLYVY